MKRKILPFKSWPSIVLMPEEIKVFVASSKRSIFAYIVSILAMTFLVLHHAPFPIVLVWILVHVGYLIIRSFEYKRLCKAISLDNSLDTLVQHNIILLGVGGILWGTSPWMVVFFAPDVNAIYYILAITFGLSAGTVATISSLYIGFVFFVSSMLMMQVGALLYVGGEMGNLLAVLTAIFMVVILISGRYIHKILRKSQLMAKRLNESKEKLSTLNASLQHEVEKKVLEINESYYHDTLTGLENLIKCHDVLKEADDNYLMLVDISGFGNINKCYGKEFADEVLVQISKYLKANLYSSMSLYKGESDRFLIYVEKSSEDEIKSFSHTLIAFFDIQEIEVEKESLFVSFNMAAARVDSTIDVMVNCELALEDAKELGTKQYAFFTQHKAEEKLQLQNSIIVKHMIENDDIIPYYQAIKDIKKNQVLKYEVLARGIYNDEIIAPFFFIEVAKRLGILSTITRMIIAKSFQFFEDKTESFSINITEQDLRDAYLIPYLKKKLDKHNIEPKRVTLEVLENIDISEKNVVVVQTLKDLKVLGCEIAIDDFGVANSNFLRLLEIEFDYIKLDGVFIQGLEASPKKQMIVEGIVKLAQTMGIKTVAEFVENQEIYEVLERIGVDYAQGYVIHKPSKEVLNADV
jgi:EAL domain-containing protein (putative c-di-GMP-specific phosphodiesterase class I)/GGDEF domain-containing protein